MITKSSVFPHRFKLLSVILSHHIPSQIFLRHVHRFSVQMLQIIKDLLFLYLLPSPTDKHWSQIEMNKSTEYQPVTCVSEVVCLDAVLGKTSFSWRTLQVLEIEQRTSSNFRGIPITNTKETRKSELFLL